MDNGFPEIWYLDDVWPYVKDKEEFVLKDKDGFYVIDYNVQKEDTFDNPLTKECRGIKFWKDGTIAARPLHKFFNRGERPDEEQKWAKGALHGFYEKLDGSLIHFMDIELNGPGPVPMTKGGYTDVAKQCHDELPHMVGTLRPFLEAIRYFNRLGLTLCFEYTSPTNRIVVKYDKPSLTLIAVRENKTGVYHPLDAYSKALNVPRAELLPNHITTEVVKQWENREGMVVVFENSYRLKVKSDDYVLKHRTKDSLSQEKNILGLVLEESTDDLAGILDEEDYKSVKKYEERVLAGIDKTADRLFDVMSSLPQASRKQVALALKEKTNVGVLDKKLLPVCFKILDGAECTTAVKDFVKSQLTSQTKIDNIRTVIKADWKAHGMLDKGEADMEECS